MDNNLVLVTCPSCDKELAVQEGVPYYGYPCACWDQRKYWNSKGG